MNFGHTFGPAIETAVGYGTWLHGEAVGAVAQLGEVLAVGPGDFQDGERVPMDLEAGDLVVYSKYGGTEVKYEGVDYLILSSRDVLAVIR